MEATFGYEKDRFDKECDYCGCIFEVVAPGQKGHEASEEYYCPECHNEYHCRASLTPTVTLKKQRTDGKKGRCVKCK